MKKEQATVKKKYDGYSNAEMILRDHLAHDRTVLALERTILAYVRTVFLLLTTGITIIKLLGSDPFFLVLGIFLLPVAAIVFAFGIRRFFVFREALSTIYKKEWDEKNG